MLRGSKSSTRVRVFFTRRHIPPSPSFSLGPCTSLRTAKNEVDTTLLYVSDDMGAQTKHFLPLTILKVYWVSQAVGLAKDWDSTNVPGRF